MKLKGRNSYQRTLAEAGIKKKMYQKKKKRKILDNRKQEW